MMAGCCGTPTMAQAAIAGMIDRGAASGALVKLVYTGSDATVRPYTVDGNVYMFGNTPRRRVNAVAARVLPFFSSAQSPHYGKFAVWDATLYAADGLPLVQGLLLPDPGLVGGQGETAPSDPGLAGGQGETAPPAVVPAVKKQKGV